MNFHCHNPAPFPDCLAATYKVSRSNVGLDDVRFGRALVLFADPLALHHELMAGLADLSFTQAISLQVDCIGLRDDSVDDLPISLDDRHLKGLQGTLFSLFVLVAVFVVLFQEVRQVLIVLVVLFGLSFDLFSLLSLFFTRGLVLLQDGPYFVYEVFFGSGLIFVEVFLILIPVVFGDLAHF